MNQDKIRISYNATLEVSPSRLSDLLCTALEGGSNYWYLISDRDNATKDLAYHEVPMAGGFLVFKDEIYEATQELQLNFEKMVNGLKIMATLYPRHFKDFVNENEDAVTGDVFLQCCLFGEIKYG